MTRARTGRILLLLAAALAAAATLSVRPNAAAVAQPAEKDDAGARAAFRDVYKVLMHPRCMNCHPSGESPLQGDDSHVHMQNVKRGADGMGKYALKCANCHQDTNLSGLNMPPGNPNWHLPKKDMPLVFQGKSPRELADQLKDPKRNGGKTLEQLVEHVTNDKLVLWGWEPGDGRTKPPLSHEEFVKKLREWVEKGAASPE
jgi:mono/diheme cytochrome c family protein